MKITCALAYLAVASAASNLRFKAAGKTLTISFDGTTLSVPGYITKASVDAACKNMNSQISALEAEVNRNEAAYKVNLAKAVANAVAHGSNAKDIRSNAASIKAATKKVGLTGAKGNTGAVGDTG